MREWLDARDPESLFKANVGQDPSLADIVKMVHPRPKNPTHEALFGYFINREYAADALPDLVRAFEAFKKGESKDVPDVPFQMLTALKLGTPDWVEIACRAPWHRELSDWLICEATNADGTTSSACAVRVRVPVAADKKGP